MRNDLYAEEFIQNSDILRQLLGVLLVDSDWENIATEIGKCSQDASDATIICLTKRSYRQFSSISPKIDITIAINIRYQLL